MSGTTTSVGNSDSQEDDSPICPPIDSESWCRTKTSEDVKHTFAWTIERFSDRQEANGSFLWSSRFSIRDSDDQLTQWKLKLYPKGDTPDAAGYLSVYLSNQTDMPVKARYEFTILDNSKIRQNKVKSQFTEFRSRPDSWGFRKFVSAEYLRNRGAMWLPDDSLTIVCDVSIVGQEKILSGCKFPDETSKNLNKSRKDKCYKQLSQDLEQSFHSEEFADCKVVCRDREFNCHMFMLSSRSAVFRAMFSNKMEEATTRKCEIKDLSPEVVEDMLEFIYTGNIPNLSQGAGELLGAAEKYQLDQLKNMCEDKLCSTTNIDNAVANLVLGDMFQAHHLKKMALSFVVKNMSTVVRTRDWRDRLLNQPLLMAEVLEAMAKRETSNAGSSTGSSGGGGSSGSRSGEPSSKRVKTSNFTIA